MMECVLGWSVASRVERRARAARRIPWAWDRALGVGSCSLPCVCVFYYVNWGADLACDKFKVEHGKIMRGCKFGCGVAAYLLLPV
jgi:hypothetical protein